MDTDTPQPPVIPPPMPGSPCLREVIRHQRAKVGLDTPQPADCDCPGCQPPTPEDEAGGAPEVCFCGAKDCPTPGTQENIDRLLRTTHAAILRTLDETHTTRPRLAVSASPTPPTADEIVSDLAEHFDALDAKVDRIVAAHIVALGALEDRIHAAGLVLTSHREDITDLQNEPRVPWPMGALIVVSFVIAVASLIISIRQ